MNDISTIIKLTDACNKQCPFCYAPRGKHFLDKNSAYKFIEFLGNNFSRISVAFLGGEPSLYDLDTLIEILNYSYTFYKSTFSYSITSNGHILKSKKYLDLIDDYDINVTLSLNCLEDIQNFCNSNYTSKFNITVIINKHNIKDIEQMAKILVETGVEYYFIPVHAYSPTETSELLDLPEFEYYYKDYIRNFNEIEKFDRQVFLYMNTIKNRTNLCWYSGNCLGNRLVMNTYGDIYTCDIELPELKLCNIEDIKAFNITSFTQNLTNHLEVRRLECSHCDIYPLCRGGCPQAHLMETGDLKLNGSYQCNLTKIIFKLIKEYVHERV